MAHLAIEAVQHRDSQKNVVIVGQPGIGKTRGSLAYTLQILLFRGKAALRVGFKSNQAHLFLPQGDGKGYSVWSCKAEFWSRSLLVDKPNLYVLIDPPENMQYVYMARCHVIKYSLNNEKHYRNFHKNGVILVTASPTENELVAMTRELWGENSPCKWQQLSTRFRSDRRRY